MSQKILIILHITGEKREREENIIMKGHRHLTAASAAVALKKVLQL